MVLFATYSGALGGAERLLLEWAGAVGRGCAIACPAGALALEARAAGVKVFELRARRLQVRAGLRDRVLTLGRLIGHGLELRALTCDLDPDVVVIWGMRSAIAGLLTGSLGSGVLFAHNDLLPGPLIGFAVRAAARRAARVTVPSQTVASDLGLGGRWSSCASGATSGGRWSSCASDATSGGRVLVISPGVDVDAFAAEAPPLDPPEVLVLGALVGWKRPDLALEACALARRRVPGLRLRFVGAPLEHGGDLIERLRARASQPDLEGAVEFAGFEADPRGALARSSCLLHCAPREPFGLAVLEALAAGRPAVVPASGGPAEIVDTSCAVLYAPGDAAAAADALAAVLAQPDRAAAMGTHGRERARARFGAAGAPNRFADVVDTIAAERGRVAHPTSPDDLPALVTVSHNSAPELDALLGSVERHLPGIRVVVVDCASEDGTLALAPRREFVTTIALSSNVGFGRACNRGLASVSEPVAILLNPDVELLDDSLLALAGQARRADRLLAPLVLSPDGSRQDTVHPRPCSAPDLMRVLVPPRSLPGAPGVAAAPWRSTVPRRVGWAVGCALAAQTEMLRRLGPFDEQIFLYGEDLDLGLRAPDAGVETWFWPGARVLHRRAHSSTARFGGEPFELLARGRREVIARRLGARRAHLDDAAQALTFAVRIAGKPLLGRTATRERAQLRALRAARRRAAAG